MPGAFTWIDWSVVFLFLALATWIGKRVAGRPVTLRDFFLGGRRLPWYAVSASLVATEVSAVTLVGLPAMVFQQGGDLRYLQLVVLGSFFARWIVAWWLVPAYYEREILSPYDYMERRLGCRVRSVTTALFALGGVLAQSCRVYLTALVLQLLLYDELTALAERTGLSSLALAVIAIALVAVAWTWIGGIASVVWTDAMLFLVFLISLVIALSTAAGNVDGGLGEVLRAGGEAGKLRFLDTSVDPTESYTLWTALFAATWLNVGAYGTDQLLAQRLFCCASAREAQKAMLASYAGIVIGLLAAAVGLALFAYYAAHPLEGRALELFAEKSDRILPLFTLEAIPQGLRGILIAGIFAAAISSFDSVLAALSQTTLSATWLPWRRRQLGLEGSDAPLPPGDERLSVTLSRVLVVLFGVLLAAAAVAVDGVARHYPTILDLALAMATYTWGALFAGFLLSFLPWGVDGSGYRWAAPVGVVAVFAATWHTPQAQEACAAFGIGLLALWAATRLRRGWRRPEARRVLAGQTVLLVAALLVVQALTRWATFESDGVEKSLAWPWNVPLSTLLVLALGIGLGRRRSARATRAAGVVPYSERTLA